jgi:hypothetical protein
MLTDGYIGNEAEIIEHVGKNCGDQVRFWTVGIGQAPNMFLVDGVAKQGGGMGKKLGLRDDAGALAQEIMTRIQRAQLAKIKIDWGGLDVVETYPAKIPELWAGRPVILFGRYRSGGDAAINVSGLVEGESVSWPLQVKLPENEQAHDVLAKVWARKKIEDLMQQSYYAGSPEVEEVVTALALDYKLMSQYTSFVAVDAANAAQVSEPAERPRRMLVPVPLPEGTRWEGFFGPSGDGAPGEAAEEQLALGVAVSLEAKKESAGRTFYDAYGVARGYRGGAGYGAGGLGGGLGGFGGRVAGEPVAEVRRLRLQNQVALPRAAAPVFPVGDRLSVMPAGGAMPGRASTFRGIARGRANLGRAANQPAMPMQQSLFLALDKELDEKSGKDIGLIGQALGYTQQALAADMAPVVKAAAATLASAKAAQKGGETESARDLFSRAFFLDRAAANVGASDGSTAAEALAALEELHAEHVKAWSKDLPALDRKLDLVIRDRSLQEAIADVAEAAGLSIGIVQGSLDDAAALAGDEEIRVTYLDLRRATVAQALDWLVMPERLSWSKSNDGIRVTSDRRRPGRSAWVYDVSLIALPSGEELQKLGDWQKSVDAAKKEAEQFAAAARGQLGMKTSESSLVWFAPGQLLVIGDPKVHAQAQKLFADLADPQAKLRGGAASLHKVTTKRFAERNKQADQLADAKSLLEVANTHEQYGWQLLAAAAAGSTDLEALTELQIAWRRPETARLLKGSGRGVILRSWWIVNEAHGALGQKNEELAALVESADRACQPAADEAVAALAKKPDDGEAFAAVLYSVLARRNDRSTAKVLPLVSKSSGENDPLATARTIAKALLADRQSIDSESLAQLAGNGVAGADLTVLLAMACKRAGGEAWDAYRAAADELIGGQPLDGSVVMLVNRLAGASLPTWTHSRQ